MFPSQRIVRAPASKLHCEVGLSACDGRIATRVQPLRFVSGVMLIQPDDFVRAENAKPAPTQTMPAHIAANRFTNNFQIPDALLVSAPLWQAAEKTARAAILSPSAPLRLNSAKNLCI